MIKNERQYRITKAQAEEFARTLKQFDNRPSAHLRVNPRLIKAQQEALQSQLDSLRAELREYERLRAGRRRVPLAVLEELPRMLIRARIAAGLTQRELAHRAGIKEQQIQRYEATEYASASLDRVRKIAQAIEAQSAQRTPRMALPRNSKSLRGEWRA